MITEKERLELVAELHSMHRILFGNLKESVLTRAADVIEDHRGYATVRYDCSAAERDEAIHNKLLELGWTAPQQIGEGK